MVAPLAALGLLGGLGSAASGLVGMFGHHKKSNPAHAANKYLSQIPGKLNPYFQPYIDQGKTAMGNLGGQYDQMLKNPGELMANLAKGFQSSPGYQFKLQQALNAGGNAAARGGMLGTPADVQQNTQIGHDIANQDYEEYLKHVLGLYGTGISGEQGQQQLGYNASSDYANSIGNVLGQQAQNAYAGQDYMNQNSKNNWQNLFGGAGQAATGYLSGDMMTQMFNKYMNGG